MNTGGGIEIVLEDALVDYISNWTNDETLKIKYHLVDPNDSTAASLNGQAVGTPAVYSSMVPKQITGTVDINTIPVFPFVLCYVTEGIDQIPEGCIYTKIVVGTWDDDVSYQGRRDCLRLLRKVIRKIWYVNTLIDSFQMENETRYKIYESPEVTFPYFMAEATQGWRLRTPITISEGDLEINFPSLPDGTMRQPIIKGVGSTFTGSPVDYNPSFGN